MMPCNPFTKLVIGGLYLVQELEDKDVKTLTYPEFDLPEENANIVLSNTE